MSMRDGLHSQRMSRISSELGEAHIKIQ
jgi:hypothetical protein